MRLDPIEKPRGLVMRVAYWMSRRQLGDVMSPLKVMYARAPFLSMLSYRMARIQEKKLSLDPELVLLVTTQSSMLNGCGFCADLHRAQALRAKLGLDKFDALMDFDASSHFDDREKAALAYTEEVTRTRDASDATFAELRKHFSEREIIELTWLNAVGNYFNLMAAPLRIESDGFEAIAIARAG